MKKRYLFYSAIVLLFFVFVALLFKLYPTYLWFNSFDASLIWMFMLKAKWVAFGLGFLVSFGWLSVHVLAARKTIASFDHSEVDPDIQTPFNAFNQVLKSFIGVSMSAPSNRSISAHFYLIIVGFLSVFFGLTLKSWWQTFYMFIHQTPFQGVDPIFHKNISFYIFSLPFLEKCNAWFFGLIFVSLMFVGWIYFSNQLLKYIFYTSHRDVRIKRHIFILLGFLFISFVIKVWLARFSLLYSSQGIVFGAGYTDIFAKLLGYKVLLLLCFVTAILFFIFAFRQGVFVPFIVILFTLVIYFVIGNVYPGLLQKYVVSPNEMEKEQTYIEHNIKYTRQAYGLDQIVEKSFPVKNNLTHQSIVDNRNIVNNIRLWNQEPLKATFRQLQEIRLYYEFHNVDVDRYFIGDHLQQVMLSARELDSSQLQKQAQTWVNQHLVFTHGYGLCMSPVNEITSEGLPTYLIRDIPPVCQAPFKVTRPEVYFGEKTSDYIIVNSKQREFDYPKGDKNVYTSYSGKGGVKLDSFFKRLCYSLKFSEINILISTLITSESRLLYDREIKTIVSKIAPFLAYDQDPYLVVDDKGNMVWMLDAYTTSSYYPYSEPFGRSRINYIRNSVKVTINAFSGEIQFYTMAIDDPIIETYSKIFKGFFKPFQDMPASLKQHIRYPKELFAIQSLMYQTYHMLNPQVFYNREDVWNLPKINSDSDNRFMQSYYMVTKLPTEKKESFVLMIPFTPSNKNNMIAWMGAKCDLDHYGQLIVYKFPKKRTIYGPLQIESRIDQDTDISQKLTLWGQVGSNVIRGNLMVIPIEDSLIYVEPIYLQATQSKLPELKRVIFAYGDQIKMADTLSKAIESVILVPTGFDSKDESVKAVLPISKENRGALKRVTRFFGQLKQAMKDQNWIKFGELMDTIDKLLYPIPAK